MDPRLYIPAVSISASNILTTTQCGSLVRSAINVPLRPPGWVFGVVWPILYVTTGLAWSWSKKDTLFSLVIATCCLWLYIYSCLKNKKAAAFMLLSTALLSWHLVRILSGKSRNAIIPLALWTSFATYLNTYDAFA
jgi:translocator protein|tara:strand:- start:5544 stop:5951 length:408 start_codon:yes stop_codon:yes gene_type:complete